MPLAQNKKLFGLHRRNIQPLGVKEFFVLSRRLLLASISVPNNGTRA
jgi:hypothetical protein